VFVNSRAVYIQPASIDAARQAAAQIRRGYAQSETTIHGAPRFSPVAHSQDPRGEVTACNQFKPQNTANPFKSV
jgi:hypothetical protein